MLSAKSSDGTIYELKLTYTIIIHYTYINNTDTHKEIVFTAL